MIVPAQALFRQQGFNLMEEEVMPLPIFALAIPVIHSSGGWIASSAGAYIAGTLSTSWIHAFVLGNLGFLSNIGLVSAGSIFGAAVAGGGSALGAGLTSIGLGGLAQSLGLVPATF